MEDNNKIFNYSELMERMSGDRELVQLVLAEFSIDLPRQLTQFAEALAAEDHATIGRLAHTCKGVAANVGARGIREAAAEIENLAAAGQVGLQPALRRLQMEAVRFQRLMSNRINF